MKTVTALALALAPLLVVAHDGLPSWHFETQSGRADGSGTKRCQKFYMKKQENFTFKIDHHASRSSRIKRYPQSSQSGEWGNYNPQGGNNYNPQGGNYNPSSGNYNPTGNYNPPTGNYNPPTGNYNPPSGNYNPTPQPKPNNNNNKPQPNKPQDKGNGGTWNGPTRPSEPARCCLKMYTDDDCKDLDIESCVEDKSDEKRNTKGKAPKEFRGFNIACTPDAHVY